MMKRNLRFAVFAISMVALMVTISFLPASAQLSQWRSLNPTRDGTAGRVAPAPYLYGDSMLTTSYAWAVGGTCDIFTGAGTYPGNGFALFWDGARWRQTLVPAGAGTLTSVFIVGANDVWAVGMGATIIHWDGTSWTAALVPAGITDLFSVFIMPSGLDGWAVGRACLCQYSKMVRSMANGCLVCFHITRRCKGSSRCLSDLVNERVGRGHSWNTISLGWCWLDGSLSQLTYSQQLVLSLHGQHDGRVGGRCIEHHNSLERRFLDGADGCSNNHHRLSVYPYG